jgi:hypothetical protein
MNTEQKSLDILSDLRAFVSQRPGFDLCNYSSMANYRGDYNPTLQAKHDFEAMYRYCQLYSISAESILSASEHAFSGRLKLAYDPESRQTKIDYCVGQYWPTEYRSAACAVLASAIWSYWRECGYDTGDKLRKQARNEFSRGMQSRWFH